MEMQGIYADVSRLDREVLKSQVLDRNEKHRCLGICVPEDDVEN